jgi:Secretion system C-terminal sorting domain
MKKIITLLSIFQLAAMISMAQPVLVSGFNGMAAVNGTTYHKTGTVGNPTGGYGFVCASNDRMKFFASWFFHQYLYFIDPSTFNVTDSMNYSAYEITAANEPNNMFARTAYGLSRINTTTKTVTDSIAIPTPQYTRERPNSKEVWVTSNNLIYVINYASGLTSTSFAASAVTTDNGEMKFTTGGTLCYKVAWTSNKIYKINAITKAKIDSVSTAPSTPSGVAISADSSQIFVSFPSDFKVRVYATSTMTIVDSISTGTREPFDMYRHPDRPEIWVVNHFKDSVTVYNEASHAFITAFDVNGSPHSLAFGIGSTGINDNHTQFSGILAYPNPAKDFVKITGIPDNATINLSDVTGRIVLSRRSAGIEEVIDTKNLNPGTYFLKVSGTDSRKAFTTQVVIR